MSPLKVLEISAVTKEASRISMSVKGYFSAVYKGEKDISFVRRTIKGICETMGFPVDSMEQILTCVTEALTNVSKYAGDYGKITSRPYLDYRGRVQGIEIEIEDEGPGSPNKL